MIGWSALLLCAGLAGAAEQPDPATLVFYNARMALREDRPLEATRLWLLRNTLESQTGELSPYDDEFLSVTWAALGDLGVCQDGLPLDEDGAGVWPVALHNWVVRNRRRRPARPPTAFEAFEVGRQQRNVSIDDVLSAEEISTFSALRGRCMLPHLWRIGDGRSPFTELSDPEISTTLLLVLLQQSRFTLDPEKVRGTALIDARLFDLQLQLVEIAEREARRITQEQIRKGREAGLSKEALAAIRDQAPTFEMTEDTVPARILKASADWPVEEWMALSHERRLYLYDAAQDWAGDKDAFRRLALEIGDALVAAGEGAEVEKWLARGVTLDTRADVWSGERGRRLLTLDASTGFRQRSAIALHRGVDALERGDLQGSLHAMALAIQTADEAPDSEATRALALRWLRFVAAQFTITEELMITLQSIVPRREFSMLLEDLLWAAALRSDRASWEEGLLHQPGRGALERRLELLGPLAGGDLGGFLNALDDRLAESPVEAMRLVGSMLERLQLEEADVRVAHIPTLEAVANRLRPFLDPTISKRQARTAAELMAETQAILEGLGSMPTSSVDRARLVDPQREVYAGSVRLAPTDALPWPFAVSVVAAPSVFQPIELIPVEWTGSYGERVFGWKLTE